MSQFTGRRGTGAAKRIGRALLDGLDTLGTAMNDGPKRQRISEIDNLIIELQQERDHLIAGLYEPGDLKVSDNYDPKWRKADEDMPTGRLTECRGKFSDGDVYSPHPACPYKDTVHRRHEFTAND
jgi:hypothetical protein